MSESGFKNRVVLLGQLITKRFRKFDSGRCLLDLFVRTSTEAGNMFCISCKVWDSAAVTVNKQLSKMGIEDGEALNKENAPMLKIKGELKQDSWKSAEDEWVRQMVISTNEVEIDA